MELQGMILTEKGKLLPILLCPLSRQFFDHPPLAHIEYDA